MAEKNIKMVLLRIPMITWEAIEKESSARTRSINSVIVECLQKHTNTVGFVGHEQYVIIENNIKGVFKNS